LPVADLLEQELRDAIDTSTTQAVRDECSRALVAIHDAMRILAQSPRAGDTFFAG
jgi:hypothetical protein